MTEALSIEPFERVPWVGAGSGIKEHFEQSLILSAMSVEKQP